MKHIVNDHTIDDGEDGIILTDSYTQTGLDVRPTLANQDVTGENKLTCITLDTQSLGIAIATIAA